MIIPIMKKKEDPPPSRNRYDDGENYGEESGDEQEPPGKSSKKEQPAQGKGRQHHIDSTDEEDGKVRDEKAAEQERSRVANAIRDAHRQGREEGIKAAKESAGKTKLALLNISETQRFVRTRAPAEAEVGPRHPVSRRRR